jgi:hypothetical protein
MFAGCISLDFALVATHGAAAEKAIVASFAPKTFICG